MMTRRRLLAMVSAMLVAPAIGWRSLMARLVQPMVRPASFGPVPTIPFRYMYGRIVLSAEDVANPQPGAFARFVEKKRRAIEIQTEAFNSALNALRGSR